MLIPSYTFQGWKISNQSVSEIPYLIGSHIQYPGLVYPLPDSVGLLAVLSVVEDPCQLVSQLEHLHILDSLFSPMCLNHTSYHNLPKIIVVTNLVKPYSPTTNSSIPPLSPHPVKDLP